MDKKKIKKVLSGLGIATLVAGMGLFSTGCNAANSSGSCGNGSGGSKEVEEGKASCGKGSCGSGEVKETTEKAVDTATEEAEDAAKSSCGKGSCGK